MGREGGANQRGREGGRTKRTVFRGGTIWVIEKEASPKQKHPVGTNHEESVGKFGEAAPFCTAIQYASIVRWSSPAPGRKNIVMFFLRLLFIKTLVGTRLGLLSLLCQATASPPSIG